MQWVVGLLMMCSVGASALGQTAWTDPAFGARWAIRVGAGPAIAAEGDQTAPTPFAEITSRIAGPLHASARVSYFHDDTGMGTLAFGAARLSLASIDLGPRVTPVQTDRHRLGFTLAPSLRRRSGERVVATRGFVDDPSYVALVESARAIDLGYVMSMEYGIRLSRSTAVVAEMRGADYRHGTSVFLFGAGLQIGL